MAEIDAKAVMRRRMRRLRRSLAPANPDAGREAAGWIPQALLARKIVSGYLPVAGEFDSRPVMRRLAESGALLALPAIRAAALEFRTWRDDDELTADEIGLPAPARDSPAVRPDLVFAPLLAFDRRGGRLGQGGGHFDRAIALLRSCGTPVVVGLAFAEQEVDAVPTEAHDARLDAVLTERGYILCGWSLA